MSVYTPDCWVIVEFSGTKVPETYHRILAGWYGGYLDGDSWKMSSGILQMNDRDDHWEIPNSSGSIYYCYKRCERFSMLTGNVFSNYSKDSCDEYSIKRIPIGNDDERTN